MPGVITQVSVSLGGVPKLAVPQALLTPHGVEGDLQRHTQFHGGPRKAVLLIAQEALDLLCAQGFPLYPGALGENLTTSRLDFRSWRPAQRYRIGQALLELTQPRVPCNALSIYGDGIRQALFDAEVKALNPASPRWGLSGFYAAVLSPGMVRPGDIITLVDQAV